MSLKNPLTLNTVVVRQPDLTFAEVDGDLVILSIQNSKYYGSEIVGRRVWHLIEQPISIAQICETLLNEFEVERATCEADVLAFLVQLVDENLAAIRDS